MKHTINVKSGSKKGPLIISEPTGELSVFLRERAVSGRANKALITLLSDYFEVPKTKINIIYGQKSRKKIIEISD